MRKLVSGVEGTRTLTDPLKRRTRCHYATTPNVGAECVSIECSSGNLPSKKLMLVVTLLKLTRVGFEPDLFSLKD